MENCEHKEVIVSWHVNETGEYDANTNTVSGLTNRDWGFVEGLTCMDCGFELTGKKLDELKVE